MSTREADMLVALQKAVGHTPGIYPAARALSFFGEHSLGWLGLAAVGYQLDRSQRSDWAAMGAAAFGAHAASVLLKRIVRRPRPHDTRIKIGVSTPSRLSFPSSHASSTTAALVYTSAILGSAAPLAGVPLMMASRMVLGVHYPTDVTAGALLGWGSAAAVRRFCGAPRRTR